jgi:DNA methylase
MPLAYAQLDLLPELAPNIDGRVVKIPLHVSRSTFLGGLATKVHRWFRLTPSFGPELVRKSLADMNTAPNSVILDPFAGAGTTLIQAKLEGHQAIGFEVNPLLHFVCNTSLNWSLEPTSLREQLLRIKDMVRSRQKTAKGFSFEELGLIPPPIHNVHRWWREDVLKDLLLLLDAIRVCGTASESKSFFELALAGVLVPDLTNVTLGRLQLHFIDRSSHSIHAWETFESHALRMISDLEEVEEIVPASRPGRVFHTDATNPQLPPDLPLVNRVVTSPPYPNRYSYVWNTRPHLYMLGLFHSAKQASALDLKTIGGTWGTATSVLAKGTVEPAYQVLSEVVLPVVKQIRKADNLMANYVMKYFNKLADQIAAQDPLLTADAQLAYVVGCSTIKDVYVETDVLLGKVFEGLDLGYGVSRIERFRQRHSGKDLHESTVYVYKS